MIEWLAYPRSNHGRRGSAFAREAPRARAAWANEPFSTIEIRLRTCDFESGGHYRGVRSWHSEFNERLLDLREQPLIRRWKMTPSSLR